MHQQIKINNKKIIKLYKQKIIHVECQHSTPTKTAKKYKYTNIIISMSQNKMYSIIQLHLDLSL